MVRTMNVACIGDSLTEGGGVACNNSYPNLLQNLLNAQEPSCHWNCHNLGVIGSCTAEWLSTHLADKPHRNAAAGGVDLYLVMLGTNDAPSNKAFQEHAFHDRLTQVVRTLMNGGTTVIVVTPPPVSSHGQFSKFIDAAVMNTLMPRIYAQVAAEIGCPCCSDVFSALGGATPKREAFIDGVHLMPEGNQMIAGALLNPILRLFSSASANIGALKTPASSCDGMTPRATSTASTPRVTPMVTACSSPRLTPCLAMTPRTPRVTPCSSPAVLAAKPQAVVSMTPRLKQARQTDVLSMTPRLKQARQTDGCCKSAPVESWNTAYEPWCSSRTCGLAGTAGFAALYPQNSGLQSSICRRIVGI